MFDMRIQLGQAGEPAKGTMVGLAQHKATCLIVLEQK